MAGLSPRPVLKLRVPERQQVLLSTARKVRDVFAELEFRVNETREGRITATRAERNGWHRAADWDDILAGILGDESTDTGLDEVAIQSCVDGRPVPLTARERDEVVRRLNSAGFYDTEISPLVGVSAAQVLKIRRRLNLAGNSPIERNAA